MNGENYELKQIIRDSAIAITQILLQAQHMGLLQWVMERKVLNPDRVKI